MADGVNPMSVGSDIGAAGGDLIGSLIGEAMARGDYEEAARLRAQAAQQYEGIGLPGEQAKLGPSAYEGVGTDPRIRDARMTAMQRMLGIGMEGGMDLESRAALQEAQQQAGGFESQQRGAILDAAQRRGTLSAGTNVAAQLQASQAGANRVAQAGTQAASDARSRAMQALMASGSLGAGLERDDYGQKANLADRRDAITEFNARNAQAFAQQRFGNQMDLADKKYGAARTSADDAEDEGDKKVAKARGYGRTGGSIAGTATGLAAL